MQGRERLRQRIFGRAAIGGLVLLVALVAAGCAQTGSADGFGQPESGRRVYDRAGVLAASEVRYLEERAGRVAQAGAPIVVFLRVRDADYDETEQDARDLMGAWDVQSAPDARDGVVIFLNLEPGNTRHGQVALYAGQRHYRDGNLPERELKRIFEDEMRPLLADEQLAAGIGAGLDAIAHSLTYGPPDAVPLSPARRAVGSVAGLPLNILALLAGGGAVALARRVWRTRPARVESGSPTTTRPGTLAPALAGALASGRMQATQLAEATLLDLARRGALVVEPAGRRSALVRPLDGAVAASLFEQQLWAVLAGAAGGDGTVSARDLGRLRSRWGPFGEAVRAEMIGRGWYDPDADTRRRPLYLAGAGAIAASVVAAGAGLVGEQLWALLAAGIFLASGLALTLLGYAYPATSAQGERAAAPWRAYRTGLKRAARDVGIPLDLDAVLPDAVAFGVVAALDRRLKAASQAGYAPAWFARQADEGTNAGFYPIWVVFHASVSPSNSGGGSGAAAGGGGAGGGF
ncbi:MAG: DUF2207 domain-containing protein [Thermomicrobiales bacterium]